MRKLAVSIVLALFGFISAFSQWLPQNSGTTKDLNSVFFKNTDTGYIVGDSGIILRTTDGGVNWASQYSGTSKLLHQVHFPCADTGYIIGAFGTLLKTINGGVNWIQINSLSTTSPSRSVCFTDALTGYGVNVHSIFRTYNGGMDWDKCWTFDFQSASVYFPSSDVGYIVGSDPTITPPWGYGYKTTDGGNNWNLVFDYCTYSANLVYFINPDTGFVNTFKYPLGDVLFKTTDGGMSWTGSILSSNIYHSVQSICFPTESIGYAVNSNIRKTYDLGENWKIQDSLVPSTLNSVFFIDSLTGYVVGDKGIIYNTIDGGGQTVGLIDIQSKSESISVFPNPFSNITTITYTLQQHSTVQITIYNHIGKQVEVIEQSQSQGKHQFVWDAEGLPRGVYFCIIKTNEGIQKREIIKL